MAIRPSSRCLITDPSTSSSAPGPSTSYSVPRPSAGRSVMWPSSKRLMLAPSSRRFIPSPLTYCSFPKSSTRRSVTGPSSSVSVSSPSTKPSVSSPSTKCSVSRSTAKHSITSPSTKRSVSSSSARLPVSSSSIKRSVSSPSTKRSVSSPSTKCSVSSPSTKRSVSSPSTKRSVSSPSTKRSVSSPSTKRSVSSPSTKRSVSSPSTKRSVSSPSTKRSVSSPSTKRSVSSPSTKRSVSSSLTKQSDLSLPTKRSVSVTSTKRSVSGSSTKHSNSSPPTKRSVSNTSTKLSVSNSSTKRSITSLSTKCSVSGPPSKRLVTDPSTNGSVSGTPINRWIPGPHTKLTSPGSSTNRGVPRPLINRWIPGPHTKLTSPGSSTNCEVPRPLINRWIPGPHTKLTSPGSSTNCGVPRPLINRWIPGPHTKLTSPGSSTNRGVPRPLINRWIPGPHTKLTSPGSSTNCGVPRPLINRWIPGPHTKLTSPGSSTNCGVPRPLINRWIPGPHTKLSTPRPSTSCLVLGSTSRCSVSGPTSRRSVSDLWSNRLAIYPSIDHLFPGLSASIQSPSSSKSKKSQAAKPTKSAETASFLFQRVNYNIYYDYHDFITSFENRLSSLACSCGGGALLGTINSVAIYGSHKKLECLVNEEGKPAIPFLLPSYFKVLKEMESLARAMPMLEYDKKVLNLIHIWEKSHCLLLSDPLAGTHIFMHFAANESALIILNPAWNKIYIKTKHAFCLVLAKILHSLKEMKNNLDGVKSCYFLMSIIKSPWGHHLLPKLFRGEASDGEVYDFVQFEKSNVFTLRLKMLCEDKCEKKAFKLSSLAMDLCASGLSNNKHFANRDFEFIKDVFLAYLHRSNKKMKLIYYVELLTYKKNVNILIKEYHKKIQQLSYLRIEKRPRIFKNMVAVCEMAACILVQNAFGNLNSTNDFQSLIENWCLFMKTLKESNLRIECKDSRIKDIIRSFIEMAPTAKHMFIICDTAHLQFGTVFSQSLFIEIYTKTLIANINEKERFKIFCDKEKSFESLKSLVQGYLKLANILEDILSVCRECVLTAYSLMPSSDLMVRVENLAIKSGKLLPEHSTNVLEKSCDKNKKGSIKNLKSVECDTPDHKENTKTYKSNQNAIFIERALKNTYYRMRSDLDKLPDPLSPAMQDNLIAVLRYPRSDTLNWNLEWPKMKIICKQYLENLDVIINRNMLQRSDLKYLDIDTINKHKSENLTLSEAYLIDNSSESMDSSTSSEECYGETPKVSSAPRRNLRNSKRNTTTNSSSAVSLSNKITRSKSNNSDNSDNSSVSKINKSSTSKCKLPVEIKRERRNVNKNEHKDFEYSWNLKKGKSRRKRSLIRAVLKSCHDNSVKELNSSSKKKTVRDIKPTIIKKEFEFPHSSKEHLSMLSERLPQLSSPDFIVPANTDHIVNVVQIQTTSNTLTNVSQTQTEHVSNHHSNNEIEKKPSTNDNQTNSHTLDNFVSVYQSSSINNLNSTQNPGIHEGECSFTGSVSVSNQRISDSVSNVRNISQQETVKPVGSHDMILDQNQVNIDHRRWNDVQELNTNERLPSSVENSVHLSSNVIVRTSDFIIPSHVSTGQLSNVTKKSSTYCKSRDRFIDLSLPATISSVSTNSNRSTNIPATVNSNKPNFDSKVKQNSSVQTSVGSQVNFNTQKSEILPNMLLNNQSSQICTADNSTSSNMPKLNEQIMNSRTNTSFVKENSSFDNLKSNFPAVVNPVSSIQTQTCIGLQSPNDVSNHNASVISSMVVSTQSQVIKTNAQNSLYTSSQSQRGKFSDLNHGTQTNRSDEQKKIDNLKLISQTFTATSEAIKFVTSNTESQRLIQCSEKSNASNIAIFQNTSESVSNISQEGELISKTSNRARGNMRTYESKTRALKQANMSDMFVFEKGTLYAVQDDINQMEPSKSVISSRQSTSPLTKVSNRQLKEPLEKPKPPPNASPNVTITGSMLPRFQQVFGKTKYQSTSVINDATSLCSTSVANNPSSPASVNRINTLTSRVYSSSKGVQTNHDVDPVSSNTLSCLSPKILENKIQRNVSMSKACNVTAIGNNKHNVIMTCKTVSSAKNITQVSASSSNQLLTSSIDTNIANKEAVKAVKIPTTFTATCNNPSIASSSPNVIYPIPIQSDSKVNKNIGKSSQCIAQGQRQLKVSPSIIQTVLRKHPNWQQNCFRQGIQSTEVQTSSNMDRLIPTNLSNIVKVESGNDSIDTSSVNTIKQNVPESSVSSSMMEQVREFESVLEEVRKTSLLNEIGTASMLSQINHEIIQIHSPSENVDLLNTDSNQTLFSPLVKKSNTDNQRDTCSFSFLNQTLSNVDDLENEEKELKTTPPSIISVRSVTPTPLVTSPNNIVAVNSVDEPTQCFKQIANIVNPVIKTPVSSPSTSTVKVPVLQKPLPKLQEDEQTTQRIYAILDKYAEQLRNSPELKNKPAPRRRTNPPTNPNPNAKRKKSSQLNVKTCSQQTSCSSSGMEMSPTSDMQAIDSEDSSNAVSQFSHIINSPSRNSDEHSTATVISETPLIENALINVNDVLKQINVDTEIKSKVSQSTQIVVSGTSGSFLSVPEGSAGNVRLLVAAGKNQKMYSLHCPVSVPGPVIFHQISTKDTTPNDVKMSSNILGQNINESAILSALTTDLQVTNTALGNDIFLSTSQKSSILDHKISKPVNIISESLEKARVIDNTEKQKVPVMMKSQACQSTFSVIHALPYKSDTDSADKTDYLYDNQSISENVQKNSFDGKQVSLVIKEEPINEFETDQVLEQERLKKTLKEEPLHSSETEESTNKIFDNEKFLSCPIQNVVKEEIIDESFDITEKSFQQNLTDLKEKELVSTNNHDQPSSSVDCISDSKVSNEVNDLPVIKCENVDVVIKEKEVSDSLSKNASEALNAPNNEKENKQNTVSSDVAAASAAEIISTANQASNTYKPKELSQKAIKTECGSHTLVNENCLSNNVYNMLDNQSTINMNTKIGPLVVQLSNDRSAENWNNCLSKIMPPGTEKMLEGENLKQLQESLQYSKIKTYKDLKIFIFEQCKKFDNNIETSKEYDLYDDIDDLGVDKPSTNELFPEVAILNDLDKSVSPSTSLLQASTSKSNDLNALQAKRKSVLSHTTTSTSTVNTTDMEPTTSVGCKKSKTKVSFLKQALYNEMIQDVNEVDLKPFVNGKKTMLELSEQIESCPESPLNTTAVDSETCMSEDSTSTISSGTPHYNFRKSKRKNIEEDGFIESQVIKRMYRGRTSEDIEEKCESSKTSNTRIQSTTTDQKPSPEKNESSNRRISNRLKNNNVKNNQHASNKSPPPESSPSKITRVSRRRVSKKTN